MTGNTIALSGYQISEQIYEGSRTLVYRGMRETDSQPAIIKVLRNPHPRFHVNRGVQVYLKELDYPLTVSWFWLKRTDNKRELRFVVSTHPYSGAYLVRLGRKRWMIEGFFKTVKHQFGLHCFGQSTKLGVYRWLLLSLIAYLLAHWVAFWACPTVLHWKATCRLALERLLPSVLWLELLRHTRSRTDIAAQFGFQIVLKPLPDLAYRDCCKI